jgi:hypothetical protein
MTPIDQLKAAGFDDKEIGDWSAQQRNTLSQAGFSNDEVDTYLAESRWASTVRAIS